MRQLKRISLLFENDDYLVLNKPAGLPVQGGTGVGASLDALLAEEWSPPPLLVHRLDKDTSGIILAAKNRSAAGRFSAFLQARRIGKRYLAVCAGRPRPGRGTIRISLAAGGREKEAETAYVRLSGGAFKSGLGVTRNAVMEDAGGETAAPMTAYSLLELTLGTGRMHQIRRHLAQIGNPILGDGKYGNFPLNKTLRRTMGLKRMLLHASRLLLPPELTGRALEIEAPVPDYFAPFMHGKV
ncbi:MAG: RluA family pseudouridine synthase [Treponema sp.]|jgi:23S rRNA pseudouridine955/2504/2580 synthase|nr:RluA family pseudouridine synthase [Treponema sp.]